MKTSKEDLDTAYIITIDRLEDATNDSRILSTKEISDKVRNTMEAIRVIWRESNNGGRTAYLTVEVAIRQIRDIQIEAEDQNLRIVNEINLARGKLIELRHRILFFPA
jgi:hypothetical protein